MSERLNNYDPVATLFQAVYGDGKYYLDPANQLIRRKSDGSSVKVPDDLSGLGLEIPQEANPVAPLDELIHPWDA